MSAMPIPRAGQQRYLIVRLAGQEFAVPAERLRGMTHMRGLAPQPIDGRGALRFIATWHGRGVPVYLPHPRLHLIERPVSARTCVLLIGQNGDPEPNCALVVDSVSRMEEIPPARVRKTPGGPDQVWVGGKWRTVLDLSSLCAE